jgi:hypothetical protein
MEEHPAFRLMYGFQEPFKKSVVEIIHFHSMGNMRVLFSNMFSIIKKAAISDGF